MIERRGDDDLSRARRRRRRARADASVMDDARAPRKERAEIRVVEVRDSEVRRFGGERGREALGVAGEKNRGGGGVLSVELRDGGDGGGEETGRARGFPTPRRIPRAAARARETPRRRWEAVPDRSLGRVRGSETRRWKPPRASPRAAGRTTRATARARGGTETSGYTRATRGEDQVGVCARRAAVETPRPRRGR